MTRIMIKLYTVENDANVQRVEMVFRMYGIETEKVFVPQEKMDNIKETYGFDELPIVMPPEETLMPPFCGYNDAKIVELKDKIKE